MQQFQDFLVELNHASPVWVLEDVDKNAPTPNDETPQ